METEAQDKFTQEDFARMLERHKNEIRKPPTLEHAARVVTGKFNEEDWVKWERTPSSLFTSAWNEWVNCPAGYIRIVLLQSTEKKLLYQTPSPPHSQADDGVPYKHHLTGETIGYSRTEPRNWISPRGVEIPEDCKYLGHTYGNETKVHVPAGRVSP